MDHSRRPAAGDVPPPLTHPSVSCRRRVSGGPLPAADTRIAAVCWPVTWRTARLCGAMRLLEPLQLGPRTAPNRILFGPHVTNLGDDDRCFTARHTAYYERRARGGCGTIVVEGASVHESDWPYERAPLAARAARRVGGDRRRLPAPRLARRRLARPRRRAGLVGLQPSAAVGAVAGAGGGVARGPQVDGGRGHRRRHRRLRRRRHGCRRCRVRRRRDQRRPAQPRAPVPVRADEPARRRVGRRPPALRPHRDHRRARRRRAPTTSSGCACRATRSRRGRASRRRWRRRSPPTSSPPASTTSSSCGDRSSPSSRPVPTSTNRPGSTSAWPRRSPPPSTCPSCCRAPSSTSARRNGRSAATTIRRRARRSR